MKFTVLASLLLVTAVMAAPAPKPKAPAAIAPQTLPHRDAMFLASICNQGARRITIKAAAVSTRFFLEEPSGVTVYAYDGLSYQREKFVKGATLEKTMKSYGKKP